MKHALLIAALAALFACSAGPAFAAGPVSAVSAISAKPAAPSPAAAGLHVFTIGHSFHANWLPGWLTDVEIAAGLPAHFQVGASMIGGSRVIQHWNLPDEKNKAKAALTGSQVDVLTMSPMLSPDPGIDNFVHLALERNPKIRITVQEFWLPFDRLDCFGEKSYGEEAKRLRDWQDPPPPASDSPAKGKPDTSHFNIPTADQLRKLHAPYFKAMDEYLGKLRQEVGEKSVLVVPVGQAVVALRAKVIAGEASGIAKQSDLFRDPLGHPTAAIQALAAYCHFAVIYQRSPVGLPEPIICKKFGIDEKLNRLLQELAWDAVIHQPLSGVKADAPAKPAAK